MVDNNFASNLHKHVRIVYNTSVIQSERSVSMRVLAGAYLVVAMSASTLNAKTIAWWPLAYENGVRTTVN